VLLVVFDFTSAGDPISNHLGTAFQDSWPIGKELDVSQRLPNICWREMEQGGCRTIKVSHLTLHARYHHGQIDYIENGVKVGAMFVRMRGRPGALREYLRVAISG
jgi:hypothetical protein